MDLSSPCWFSDVVAAVLGGQLQPSLSSESCTTGTSFNLVGKNTTSNNNLNGSSMEDASPKSSSKKTKRAQKTNSGNSCTTDISLASAPNSLPLDSPTYPLHSFGEIAGGVVKPKLEIAHCRHMIGPRQSSFSDNSSSAAVAKDTYAESQPYYIYPSFLFRNIAGGIVKPKEDIGVLVPPANLKRSFEVMAGGGPKAANIATRPANVQEHVITERKRREKLSRRFIELSAIIPGLKKIDKASILGDAIKYVKQLESKSKILEEETRKMTIESTPVFRKSPTPTDDDDSSSKENSQELPFQKPFPEIEVTLFVKTVLLKIHCQSRKGMLLKVLSEVEKLHLSITNCDSMFFAESSIHINVMAQFDGGFSMTAKELVQKLSSALK